MLANKTQLSYVFQSPIEDSFFSDPRRKQVNVNITYRFNPLSRIRSSLTQAGERQTVTTWYVSIPYRGFVLL